jgi:NADH dehydrogenase FAD-containing subunit
MQHRIIVLGAGYTGALRLRARLANLDAGQTVMVVGGGLTGVTTAGLTG